MGYVAVSKVLMARLSDHNDERDARDQQLWDELEARVKAVLSEERYEVIGAWLS